MDSHIINFSSRRNKKKEGKEKKFLLNVSYDKEHREDGN